MENRTSTDDSTETVERSIRTEPIERSTLGRHAKSAVQAIALVWVSPRLLAQPVLRLVWCRERAFLAGSESVARIPGMRGVYCRQAFYRRILASCGSDVYFGWMSTFSKPLAKIGERVYIGRHCSIGFADIGDDVMLADGVQVLSGRRQHALTTEDSMSHRDGPQTFERVEIGAGAWIGTNAIVMADVGRGAVVGAGAVVVEPVPARTVAAGVPARVVRRLDEAHVQP